MAFLITTFINNRAKKSKKTLRGGANGPRLWYPKTMDKAINTLLLALTLLSPSLSSAQCPEEEECYESDEDIDYRVGYRYRTTEGRRARACQQYLLECTDGSADRQCQAWLRQCQM